MEEEEEEGEKMILTLPPPPFPLTFQWENSREIDLPYFEVNIFAKKYPVIFSPLRPSHTYPTLAEI